MVAKREIAALFLFIANILDGYWTKISVESGEARELNPLMNEILKFSPSFFFVIKTSIVLLGIVLLIRSENDKLAWQCLVFASFAYAVILFIHVFQINF